MVLFMIQIQAMHGITHETEELKEHAKFGLFNAQAITSNTENTDMEKSRNLDTLRPLPPKRKHQLMQFM
jgi:hypothetical protein